MSPDDSGSVTHWLGALRGGELDAARLKRGGGRVRTEADLSPDGPDDEPAGLDGIASAEPTPDFAEEYRRLFEELMVSVYFSEGKN
jgi:hypothetical protein